MYKLQVDKSHYDIDKYTPVERWISYYHQIQEVRRISKKIHKSNLRVLLIGVGDGIVSSILKHLGYQVMNMDFDSKLKPDYLVALPDIGPVKNKHFDCILCCEVLEHIQLKDVSKSLKNFHSICDYAVISVPQKGVSLSLTIKFWIFRSKTFFLRIPTNFMKHQFDGQHYWELDGYGISSNKFRNLINKANFKILRDYIAKENPYHHFFILENKPNHE